MSIMWQQQLLTIEQLATVARGTRPSSVPAAPGMATMKDEIPFLIAILNSRPTGSLLTLDYGPPGDGRIKAFALTGARNHTGGNGTFAP